MVVFPPGLASVCLAVTPCILPTKAPEVVTAGVLKRSSDFTSLTAPVMVPLFCTPYPTTKTSSRSARFSVKVTVKVDWFPTWISCVLNPMKVNIKILSELGTERENLPSKSVETPVVVPFTMTVTPGSGKPLESYTVPLTSIAISSIEVFAGSNSLALLLEILIKHDNNIQIKKALFCKELHFILLCVRLK